MNQEEYKSYLRDLDVREAKLVRINKKFKKLDKALRKVQEVRDQALTKLLAEEQEVDSLKRLLEL